MENKLPDYEIDVFNDEENGSTYTTLRVNREFTFSDSKEASRFQEFIEATYNRAENAMDDSPTKKHMKPPQPQQMD